VGTLQLARHLCAGGMTRSPVDPNDPKSKSITIARIAGRIANRPQNRPQPAKSPVDKSRAMVVVPAGLGLVQGTSPSSVYQSAGYYGEGQT
jgi:hypothetical protein